MKHHRLELYPKNKSSECACWQCSPAFGLAGELAQGAVQTFVLNDGNNRVLVGVYNRPLPLQDVKRIARIAVDRAYVGE